MTYIDLHMLNYTCILRISPTFIMVYGPFNVLCNSVCFWYLAEDIYIYVYQDINLWSSSCSVLIWLWYQGNVDIISWIWECSLNFFFKELEKNWPWFFCKCLVDFTSEAIWSWVFLCWEIYDYWFNFFTHYWSVQIFYFFLWFSLDNFYVSKNLSISFRFTKFLACNCSWSYIFLWYQL